MENPGASSPPPVIRGGRGNRGPPRPSHRCPTCGDVYRSLQYLRVHQSLNHNQARAIVSTPLERSSYEQRALARTAVLHQLSPILDYFSQQRIRNRGRGRRRRQETENNCLNPSGSAPRYVSQTGATTMFYAQVTWISTMPTPFLEARQAAANPNHCMAIHSLPAPYHYNPLARQPNYPDPIEETLPAGLFPLNDANFGSRNWVPHHNVDHGVVNPVTCPPTNLVIRDPVSAPMLVGGHRDAGYMDALPPSLAYFQPAEANGDRDSAEEDNPLGLDLNLHL